MDIGAFPDRQARGVRVDHCAARPSRPRSWHTHLVWVAVGKNAMGIKFHCQSCSKKLNVKSFLAGKRGICPHCGSKIDIPAESGGPPSGAAEPALAAATTPAAVAQPHGTGDGMAAAVAPRAVPTGPAPGGNIVRPTAPLAAGGNSGRPATPVAPAMATSTAAAAAIPAGAADPVSEAPHAVWYVRPASGGQFGPAAGDIMRRWISEGRVASDSLVWREGWPEWKSASSVFPGLAGIGGANSLAAQAGETIGLGRAASGSSSASYRGRARRSNSMVVAMLVVLAIASVGLLVALIAVLGNWQP